MKTHSLAKFMLERERIRVKKEAGQKAPWTDDIILRTYRFCNIRREDDAVTRWLANHWRSDFRPDLPRAIALARLVNWPPTLGAIGYPSPFDAKRIISTIQGLQRRGKAWSSAYIVSTNGVLIDKAEYVVGTVALPIGTWDSVGASTLQQTWLNLRQYRGMGSFMAAQVVADLKNTPACPLQEASDWWDWAAPGPGSIRGVWRFYENMQFDLPFIDKLRRIRDTVYPLVKHEIPPLCLQDWQNVMCEADKYWRTQDGGRPKAQYSPNPHFP